MIGFVIHAVISAALGLFAGACLMVGAIDVLDQWYSGIFRIAKTAAVVAALTIAAASLAQQTVPFLIACGVLIVWCAWSMFRNKHSDEKPDGSA